MDCDFFKEVVIPGLIGVGIIGTACYMAINGQNLPEWLLMAVTAVLTYFLNYGAASFAARTAGPIQTQITSRER